MKVSKSILITGIVLITSAIIFNKINHCVIVHGDSMTPTLHNFQVLFYNPNGQITKNCVVVFKRGNETLIKRVSQVPGEFYKFHIEDDGRRWPVYLNKDEYFVEGDNIDNTDDSWIYGVVTKNQIIGVINNIPIPSNWNKSYYISRENMHLRSILKPTIKRKKQFLAGN